ncbi:MAG TPA: tetratricopeptide repeat protein, partial [Verrucomicrobiae bacterium]|nr:tetratricopeptide repeat protein [Verrucomicrobiae bacterium]
MAAPLFFLALLELGLRLSGFGYPVSFLLRARIHGQDMLVQNDRFGWRFFGPNLSREPFPLAVPKAKPPGTIRIFVFGESAAYGDPQPDFGLPRMLEALLSLRFPTCRFEVVNAAMTAINSHAILPIARDCARRDGDIWVVYMGNNEVVGPFGAGTVFESSSGNLRLIRAGLAVKGTRTGQLLAKGLTSLHPAPDAERGWGGMAMFLGNQVREDAPGMRTVYANFRQNLEDILDAGRRAGVHVILSTVASNLKDCAPFASQHAPSLSAGALQEWERLYRQATRAEQDNRFAEALDYLNQAGRLDDTHAELHYRRGLDCLALGRDSEALTQFVQARDLDTLRFRADRRVNEIIRQAASTRSSEGVVLVDSEKVLAAQSPHHITGSELFYEHVHLNFEGNYALALGIADQVLALMPSLQRDRADSLRAWPSEGEAARRLAWTEHSRYEGLASVLARLSNPPFTGQFSHQANCEKIQRDLGRLANTTSLESLRKAAEACEAASASAPGDWVLLKELALVQEELGDMAGASSTWEKVVKALPHYAEGWQQFGRALAAEHDDKEAIAALQESTRLAPKPVGALTLWAEVLARQGKPGESMAKYRAALKLDPYWSQALLGLGHELEHGGNPAEAEQCYRKALRHPLNKPSALNALGQLCFGKGWLGEAATNFTRALLLDPFDASAHVNLGVTLLQMNRPEEAQQHFAE